MKYDLSTIDSNAYSIMGYIIKGMRREGFTQQQIKEYQSKAMSSNYTNLVAVSLEYVDRLNDTHR